MSLNYYEPVNGKIKCGVTCQMCGMDEVIIVEESTTFKEVESHLCSSCLSAPYTKQRYAEFAKLYHGVALDEVTLNAAWQDFGEQNLTLGSKGITITDHIEQLNLNDQKTRGI
jgi:hypothetical protein